MTAMTSCPTPHAVDDRVLLAHGEGARLARRLIREILLAELDNEFLHPLADAALLPELAGRCVMSTDSYVVTPLFFPGGDIGRLAVYGTVNDLAVCGARPLYLSLALILEEGLSLDLLHRVVVSVRDAALRCGVQVVTGDVKVVPRGAADQLFVNTSGVGVLRAGVDLGAPRVRAGDRILVSGTLGDHGITILSAREQLGLQTALCSDSAPLHDMIAALLDAGLDVHFMRDATRGGVSAVLHELSDAASLSLLVDEGSLPVFAAVRGACEILGLDPLYVANEGKLVCVVAPADADAALACLRRQPLGAQAAIIGEVTASSPPQVLLRTTLGSVRVVDEPSGAPLPRIC